jgi:hypothetical protein
LAFSESAAAEVGLGSEDEADALAASGARAKDLAGDLISARESVPFSQSRLLHLRLNSISAAGDQRSRQQRRLSSSKQEKTGKITVIFCNFSVKNRENNGDFVRFFTFFS